ncbi:MAG: FliM/FliN family flagellar motor switch protein [Steroidobacteraceae bacterium]|jgi:flagellar motor switch protein FliM
MASESAAVEEEPAAESSDISEEEVSALLEKSAADGVRAFDFSSQRINRTQLPMLQIIGKSFAERATVALSGLLSRDANVEFTSVDSAKAADLQAALPTPGGVAVVRLKPLPGFAFVMVEPNLLLALLDGFFGGTGRAATEPLAAIAPAALRFLALMLRTLGPELTAAWAPVTPIELEPVKQEVNPRLLQLGGANDALTVMKFTVEFAAHSGCIDLLIPDTVLAPIREALAADGGKPPARKQDPWGPALGVGLQEAELELRAVLTQAKISLGELVRLTPGDIIPIEPPQDVILLVGDVALHRGRFGVSQGHNALKIIPGGAA